MTTSSLHRVCPQCTRVAALGRRFCGGCRAVLVRPCAACGFGNERDDVWCGGCGAGLTATRAASAGAPPAGAAGATARPPAPPPPPVPPVPPPRALAAVPPSTAPAAAPAARASGASVAELLAINARRAAPIDDDDLADQQSLDALFGESR